MNKHQNIEERLWDYIDGNSNEAEMSFIKQLIQSNDEWKLKYAELLEVHQMMHTHIELDEPSMRFRQNVMEAIAVNLIAPATKSYINKKIIWGIGFFFITMILGLIIYGFSQINWETTNTNSRFKVDFNKVDWSLFFNNTYTNLFLMINVVLGLMLLDMYLSKKKVEKTQDLS